MTPLDIESAYSIKIVFFLTASIYKRQWDRGMPKSHNLYFIGLDGLDELTNC